MTNKPQPKPKAPETKPVEQPTEAALEPAAQPVPEAPETPDAPESQDAPEGPENPGTVRPATYDNPAVAPSVYDAARVGEPSPVNLYRLADGTHVFNLPAGVPGRRIATESAALSKAAVTALHELLTADTED